jgi:signal transduction histidine kinase
MDSSLPLLGGLLDGLGDGVAVCLGDRVRRASAPLAELLGVDGPDKLEGRHLREWLEEPASFRPLPEEPVECSLRRADGELRRVQIRVYDAPPGEESVWLLRDLTALRDLEERLARERTDRDELFTVLSHELRTPVTVIAGYARMLLTPKLGELNAEQRRCVEQCERSSRRLVDLIGRLLEGAAHARGNVVLEPATECLASVVHGVAEALQPLLEPKRLRLEVDLDREETRARFDRLRMEQVLTNLVANAIRYSPPEAAIRVTARRVVEADDVFLEVCVIDQGPGVSLADRERIFLPYARGKDSRDAGGLGLGLAISRRLVEAHGGSIRVGNAPGTGACFSFRVPAPPERTQ